MRLPWGDFCEYPKSEAKRLIIGYSGNRAEKERYNREKSIKCLEKLCKSGKPAKSGINKQGWNKYLKMKGSVQVKNGYKLLQEDAIGTD
ncbi:MAG: hypothetical protein LBH90_08030 [Tannerella sp.]|jgi:hypothetical protein|nr:hypothetical protein [Tannerella sp.]